MTPTDRKQDQGQQRLDDLLLLIHENVERNNLKQKLAAIDSRSEHLEREHDSPQTGSTAVPALSRVLAERGNSYPEFAALLHVLRVRSGSHSELAHLLKIPTDVCDRFESGQIHPGHFPADAAHLGAELLSTSETWNAALVRAMDRSPIEPEPPPEVAVLHRRRWADEWREKDHDQA